MLVERGLCGFAVKARNATDAGAAGVIIYNNAYNNAANVNAAPPGMADDGINGPFVTIPTVSNLAIVGQLAGGVTGSLAVDLTIRAGADPSIERGCLRPSRLWAARRIAFRFHRQTESAHGAIHQRRPDPPTEGAG